MTYKFEQFKVEIVNPTISVDLNSIQDKAISKLLSVAITLTTDTASFGIMAEDMPYTNDWKDSDIESLVLLWLSNFQLPLPL
jgi:ribonuclease PH